MFSYLGDLFLRHPRSIGETYGEHFRAASAFGAALFVAAVACSVHAVLPWLFESTASDAVARLHGSLQTRRRRAPVQIMRHLDYQI
jgi:hypothetical protein